MTTPAQLPPINCSSRWWRFSRRSQGRPVDLAASLGRDQHASRTVGDPYITHPLAVAILASWAWTPPLWWPRAASRHRPGHRLPWGVDGIRRKRWGHRRRGDQAGSGGVGQHRRQTIRKMITDGPRSARCTVQTGFSTCTAAPREAGPPRPVRRWKSLHPWRIGWAAQRQAELEICRFAILHPRRPQSAGRRSPRRQDTYLARCVPKSSTR